MWLTHVFPLSIDHSYPENYPTITVATLAVPEFYDYSLTSYSFRVLGLLSEIQLYMEKPPQKPSLEFVFRCEICAMHTNKDPITQWFQENWKSGWSINLEKFIIILFIENSLALSCSLLTNMIDHSSSPALKHIKLGSNCPAGSSDGGDLECLENCWSQVKHLHHSTTQWQNSCKASAMQCHCLNLYPKGSPKKNHISLLGYSLGIQRPVPIPSSLQSHQSSHNHSYQITILICHLLFQSLCTIQFNLMLSH